MRRRTRRLLSEVGYDVAYATAVLLLLISLRFAWSVKKDNEFAPGFEAKAGPR